jgi:hypothetical protein
MAIPSEPLLLQPHCREGPESVAKHTKRQTRELSTAALLQERSTIDVRRQLPAPHGRRKRLTEWPRDINVSLAQENKALIGRTGWTNRYKSAGKEEHCDSSDGYHGCTIALRLLSNLGC